MLGFWGWVLVILVIATIFEYHNLPKHKEKLKNIIDNLSSKSKSKNKDGEE